MKDDHVPEPPNDTVDFWRGQFGVEYVARNRVDWAKRVPLLKHIVEETGATEFLDVGTNCGWNLHALQSINNRFGLSGVDVNRQALIEARQHFDVVECRADQLVKGDGDEFDGFGPGAAQVTITSGLLIHIPPHEIRRVMQEIIDVTSHFVLCIEYEAPEEIEVEYRGHAGKLWKRPFGKMFEDLGLALCEHGEAEGYPECHYWLLEKPQ